MKKYITFASICVIVAMTLVQAQYEKTSDFWGTITRDGATPPIGTEISAWINGEEHTTDFISTIKGQYGIMYVTGGSEGDFVQFRINGDFIATPTADWDEWNTQNVDLSCTDCNHVPNLQGGVDPSSGISSTTFTFTLTLKDRDNDNPVSVNVSINGEDYEMQGSLLEPSSVDEYKNGKQYSYQISGLPIGINSYRFIASDAFGSNQTEVLEGPTVLAESSTQLKAGWNLISIPMEPW